MRGVGVGYAAAMETRASAAETRARMIQHVKDRDIMGLELE
jgi:hypothetical protein